MTVWYKCDICQNEYTTKTAPKVRHALTDRGVVTRVYCTCSPKRLDDMAELGLQDPVTREKVEELRELERRILDDLQCVREELASLGEKDFV
jgi:hypothetical protein